MSDNQTNILATHFENINDPRMDRSKLHDFLDIILLCILATIGGADSFEDIELFGDAHEEWLKKYLQLKNGIPSHDTMERLFRRIKPKEFKEAFANWINFITHKIQIEGVIAIDGQTHRGAKDSGQTKSPLHVVSAWASETNLVLGQIAVEEKSNEITAIPQLLTLLDLNGCIVTLDAMGCQQKIAEQIINQGGDYIFGLKGNQGSTFESVTEHFDVTSESNLQQFIENDKGHGRIEIRNYQVDDAENVQDLKAWPGLKSVIRVISSREIKGEISTEERFYISSLGSIDPKKIGISIRSHWGIENTLHHSLDVTFNQDKNRTRKDHAPENLGVLRHIALNILKMAPAPRKGNKSINQKRKFAAMSTDYLDSILKQRCLEN